MERRFWLVTIMFFVAVILCFLLVASQHISDTVPPAAAEVQHHVNSDLQQAGDANQWTTENLSTEMQSKKAIR